MKDKFRELGFEIKGNNNEIEIWTSKFTEIFCLKTFIK